MLFGLLSAATARADYSTRGCETNTMKSGIFCNWAEGKSWCNGNTLTCEVESTTACPVNPTGGTYAFSCNTNTCLLSCNTGYTNCTGTCKLNVSVPSNCTTFNQCTEVCSACAQGYELSGGVCVGATLKLGSDSVGVSNYIFQTAAPVLTIPSTGNVGIGTTTPMAKLEIVPTSGYSILAGGFKIGNVGLPTADGDVTTKGYVDSVISSATSSISTLWGGTAGADIWSLNSGNVGIGTTSPTAKLNIYAGAGNGLKINGFGTGNFYGIDFTSSGLSGSSDFYLYASSAAYIRADGYMAFPYLYSSGYLRTPTLYHTAAMTIYTTSGAVTLGNASTTNIILNPGGNVGIGITAPTSKLHVYGTTDVTATLATPSQAYSPALLFTNQTESFIENINSGVFQLTDINGSKYYSVSTAAVHTFHSPLNSPAMTISAGNVGVGTAGPTAKLEVVPSTGYSILAGNYKIGNVALPTANADAATKGYVDSVVSSATSSITLWGGTTGGNIWSLNTGNVGVRTTAPGDNLTIQNSAPYKGLSITGSDVPRITLADNGGNTLAIQAGDTVSQIGTRTNNPLYFYTNSTTDQITSPAMAIINGGNIGIGTTTPAQKLSVGNTISEYIQSYGGFIGHPNANIGGTGDAAYFPEGIYSAKTNWLYGGINMNNGNLSNAGSGTFSGNVGIGATGPTAKLEVVPSTGYSILAGSYKIGNVALPTTSSDAATKGYVDSALSTGYLPLSGGTMTGSVDMGNNNITNLNNLTVNKITATTIDPLYNIKGINYSTFAPSIAGGVKEEYTGKIGIYKPVAVKEYEAVIDFDAVKEGSDLWLWRQVIDYSKDSVDVAVAPYGRSAQVYYLIDDNKLIFRSDRAVEISYRLTAKRFDWRDWPTLSHDQTTRGLEIKY